MYAFLHCDIKDFLVKKITIIITEIRILKTIVKFCFYLKENVQLYSSLRGKRKLKIFYLFFTSIQIPKFY